MQEVDSAIRGVQDLLEKKDYKTLIETIVTPASLAELQKTEQLENIIENFAGTMAQELEEFLKTLSFTKSVYDPDKQTLTFQPGKRPMVWIKIGGQWRIQN